MPNPRAGELWDVDFSPHVGHEHGGVRPALVISSDPFNDVPHQLRIVVPLTGTDRGVRSHIPVAPPEGGLTKPSVFMCEQVKSQSLERFRRRRGEIDPAKVARVTGLVARFLVHPPTDP